MRRFLITGLPRIRSAWLAALFSGERVTTFHDHVWNRGVQSTLDAVFATPGIAGLCDPGAACVYPDLAAQAFAMHPVVIIQRDADECKRSFSAWLGGMELHNWPRAVANYERFIRLVGGRGLIVNYYALENYTAVAEIYRHCTGLDLSRSRFQLFDGLKVEQHIGKALKTLDCAKLSSH